MGYDTLGLTDGVSIALGGMIGGGLFAVLGVVARLTHGAAWIAFALAGAVALCAAYSFTVLNRLSDGQGGAVTYIQSFVGNSTLAGMVGWTILVGYVGSMAMYAYAFGSFAIGLRALPEAVGGLPLRPVVSVLAVACFVGLNLLGTRTTGAVETYLVGATVAILLVFGVGGIVSGVRTGHLEYGVSRLGSVSPIVAAGVSFVAFQGWQLLFHDQARFETPVETVSRAVYISILAATALYVVVALTTVSLAPLAVIRSDPERALAVAADPVVPYGFVLVSVAALFSTGSAINATLFSCSHFTRRLLSDSLVPDQFGDADASGIPTRPVLGLGGIVAVCSTVGTLDAITSFSSLTFVVVSGTTSYLAFQQRDHESVHAVVPAVGTVCAATFFLLLLWHLLRRTPSTVYGVVLIALVVLGVETVYFERETLEAEVVAVDERVGDGTSDS